MRTNYIALLVCALVASADVASPTTESINSAHKFSVAPRPLAVDQTDVGRFLRAHKTNVDEDEERVFGFKLGFIDDIIENMSLSPQFKEMLNKRTSADKAYKAFKVDKVTDDLLASAQWKEWALYTSKLNKNDPEESLAAAMTVAYGGDGFAKIVAKAAKDPNTKELAAKLEAAQLSRWSGLDSSPDAIFKVLKLQEKTDNIFDSPQYATWTSYLKAYNQKHPTKQVSELSVFMKSYGEEGFIKLLDSADDANSAGTQKFKNELVKGWLDEPTHPLNYMKAFNKEFPHAETTMVQTFTKSYGDEKLAAMIQAATKVEETKEFAKNLQTAQFNQWMVDKKTPKDILGVLKLNSQTFTDNPSADIWRAYNKAYAKKFPDADFAFQP
ncbi:hypothetical protein PC128_g25089 [Phytophthora cactorum]|nr:hypothetical protein PC128_g25089 [Phytophthora cactorum]